MSTPSPTTLREALDFRLSEILRYDLAAGVVGGIAWAAASWGAPAAMDGLRPLAAGLMGVVVSVVIVAVAIQSAFIDRSFILKLEAIGREPVRYLAPALFTGCLGIAAALITMGAVIIAALPLPWLRITADAIAGLAVTWTLASVIPVLSMIVSFVALQREAAQVDDSVVQLRERRRVAGDDNTGQG